MNPVKPLSESRLKSDTSEESKKMLLKLREKKTKNKKMKSKTEETI